MACVQDEDLEKLKKEAPKAKGDVPSRGGLNPMAVLVLLVAIAAGLYFSKQYGS